MHIFAMRPLVLLALPLVLLCGCGIVAIPGDLPSPDTEIGGRASGARCTRPKYCGPIGFVDCGSQTDGPAYYFERSSGKVIAACGGFCMSGDCRDCPPPSWTCRSLG